MKSVILDNYLIDEVTQIFKYVKNYSFYDSKK
jgi:hypothetical protein